MHQLDGAYERVNRASEHLSDLDSRVRALCEKMSDNITVDKNPELTLSEDGKRIGFRIGQVSMRTEPVPYIFSILVGEIIYNLRSALDYLVYELARLDSKKIVDGTQFPIEDCEDCFSGRHKGYVAGLSPDHVTDIERLQPYKGCDWTRTLRDMSNPDKHRQLTASSSFAVMSIPIKQTQGNTERKITNQTMNVNNRFFTGIQFSSRKKSTAIPIRYTVDVLKQLQLQVTQTLDAFKPEFK